MPDTSPPFLDKLLAHKLLGDAPREELAWLAARAEPRSVPLGAVANQKGVRSNGLSVVVSGHVVVRVDRGAGSHKIIEWRGGEVTGLLPYSRGASPPADAIAEEATEMLEINVQHFPEMIRECPTVTAKLVHVMIDRARTFTSSDLRDEKLVSLGKLAAGLAHEINNPASAAVRAARLLTESQLAADDAARRLGAARLDATQLAALDALRDACRAAYPAPHRSGLERADREDAITQWLTAHGASESCAGPLAETTVTIAQLDTIARVVTGEALDAALRWIAAGCAMRSLAGAIETSTSRIHELVGAVKGFTFMDQAPTVESVDIRRGVSDAITMLGAKVRAKAADISLEYAADLPPVRAVGAELNQVWMNLLDNALDAIGPRGSIRVVACGEPDRVVVEVIDNGSGIPPEILWRIFDPFYTTKGVGQGTGLGLDIVRRMLQRHEGGIEAESALGRTVFRVWLPRGDAAMRETPAPRQKRPSAIVGPHSD